MEESEVAEHHSHVKLVRRILIAAGGIILLLITFFVSRKIHYRSGFNAGAVFADTSGYKHGYNLGFEQGYELRDSIAKKEKERNVPEQLNLNLIYEELGNPEKYIEISGQVKQVKVKGALSASLKKVNGIIKSSASFARYKELVIRAIFLDRKNENIGELNVEIFEILYPKRTIAFEISQERVPEFTASVQFELQNAQGMD